MESKKKAMTLPNGQVIEKDTLYNEEFGKTIQGVTNPVEEAGQIWYKTDRLSDKIVAAADNTWHIDVSQGKSETHRLGVFHKIDDQIREYFISIEASPEAIFRIASLFPPERQIQESTDTFLPNLFNGIEASYSDREKSERREFLKDLKEEFNLGDQKLEERKEKINQLTNRFVRETLSSNETVEAIGLIGQGIAQLARKAKSILRQIPYASLPPFSRSPVDSRQTEKSEERRLARKKENPGLTDIILNHAPIVKPIFQKIVAFENDEISMTEPVISEIELMTVNEETSEGEEYSTEDSFIAVMILQHIMSASVAESQTEISNSEISDHFEVVIPLIPSLIGLLESVSSEFNGDNDFILDELTNQKEGVSTEVETNIKAEEPVIAVLVLQEVAPVNNHPVIEEMKIITPMIPSILGLLESNPDEIDGDNESNRIDYLTGQTEMESAEPEAGKADTLIVDDILTKTEIFESEDVIPYVPAVIGLLEKIPDVNIETNIAADYSKIEFQEKSVIISEETLIAILILQQIVAEDNFGSVTPKDNQQLNSLDESENRGVRVYPENTVLEEKLPTDDREHEISVPLGFIGLLQQMAESNYVGLQSEDTENLEFTDNKLPVFQEELMVLVILQQTLSSDYVEKPEEVMKAFFALGFLGLLNTMTTEKDGFKRVNIEDNPERVNTVLLDKKTAKVEAVGSVKISEFIEQVVIPTSRKIIQIPRKEGETKKEIQNNQNKSIKEPDTVPVITLALLGLLVDISETDKDLLLSVSTLLIPEVQPESLERQIVFLTGEMANGETAIDLSVNRPPKIIWGYLKKKKMIKKLPLYGLIYLYNFTSCIGYESVTE